MVKLKKLVSEFLNELKTENNKHIFDSVNTLLEHLENRNDPDPIELQIVDSSYQLLEKLNILESLLRQYQKNGNENLPSNKLTSLYENTTSKGSDVLFD